MNTYNLAINETQRRLLVEALYSYNPEPRDEVQADLIGMELTLVRLSKSGQNNNVGGSQHV